MKVYHYFICSLFLAALMACSSNNDFEETMPATGQKTKYLPLTIEVRETPLMDPTAPKSSMKKAPISFLSDLNSFFLIYNHGGGLTNFDSNASNFGAWTATKKQNIDGQWVCGNGGQYGWPDVDGGTDVTWYAFGNLKFNNEYNGINNDNGFCLDFEVDENTAAQSDLLVAKKTDNYNSCNGHLYFEFDHACSALRFNMKKAKNVSSKTIVIKKVVLEGMSNQGSYSLDNGTWDVDTDQQGSFTLFESSEGKGLTNMEEYKSLYAGTLGENDDDAYLFMIPQTTPGNSRIKIELTIDNQAKIAYIPFNGQTFAKGYKYEVNINLGKSTLLDESGNRLIND